MRCRTGISGEITLELFFKVGKIWPGSSEEERRSRRRDWSKQRQRAVRAWRALVRLLRAVRGPGLTRGGGGRLHGALLGPAGRAEELEVDTESCEP